MGSLWYHMHTTCVHKSGLDPIDCRSSNYYNVPSPDHPGCALSALEPEVLGLEAGEETLLGVADLEGAPAHPQRVALWPEYRELGLSDRGEDEDGVDVLVPHQPPHVLPGLRGRMLGQDKLREAQEPRHPARVDVVGALS